MEMDERKSEPMCPIVDIDGFIADGKQFDLDITLPEDNRDVIYGVVKNCFKEPVDNAVVKLVEVVYEHGKEERIPIGHTFTDKEGEFCCTGGIEVAGVRIKCWRYYRPHGSESLRQALMNSCNPVFIGLGQKMGVHTYYNYLNKFKLLNKTGIDLPGEANSIFLAENKAGPVELATISFGQRFEITPIQLVTAVSAIANGGESVKPRLVKQIIDSQTKEVKDIPVQKEERVISKETSEKVLSMMESVVSEGTRKKC